MPYYQKSEDWFKQSSLLVQARPLTTRVTTLYTRTPPTKARNVRRAAQRAQEAAKLRQEEGAQGAGEEIAATTTKPRYATLVLKTYDPVGGACLKYQTNKSAEVSRLIQMQSELARVAAGLPPRAMDEDAVMRDAETAQPPEALGSGGGGGGQEQQQQLLQAKGQAGANAKGKNGKGKKKGKK